MDHYGNHNGSCIQLLTLVEYNKKGLTYVKLTHEVYKH